MTSVLRMIQEQSFTNFADPPQAVSGDQPGALKTFLPFEASRGVFCKRCILLDDPMYVDHFPQAIFQKPSPTVPGATGSHVS